MKKHLISVLEKRLKKVVTRQKTSFYDKFVYKLYRLYTKKAPNQELITSVKLLFCNKTSNKDVLKTLIASLDSREQEKIRLLKYSLLSTELRAAYYSNKIENIDETLKYQSYQELYKISLHKLRLKLEAGEKIRVGFLVVFDSVFPMESLYRKMLKDDLFAPAIVVVQHKIFGLNRMEKTYVALKKKYGDNVICGYNKETNEYLNFDNQFDLISTANPFDNYAHPLSSTKHFAQSGIPMFWADYVPLQTEGQNIMTKDSQQNFTWKIFPLEKYEQSRVMNNHLAGTNSAFFGWSKMDALSEVVKRNRSRKKIIIAPHHSVSNYPYHPKTSNFEKYADFFLSLPEKYPQIDWVFRPHPALFNNLNGSSNWEAGKSLSDWGEQKCQEYIAKMMSYPNVEYQDGGDYFDTFVNSDGLIHDCMSFMAEYMFTGHPCCFCKKREVYQNVNEFFEKCVNHHYIAFEEKDIVTFIEDVVLNDNDPMKESRKAFFEADLKGLYPHSTDAIIKYLKDEIKNA